MKLKTIILTLGIALMTACTSHDEAPIARVPIYICAAVESQQASTRAPYSLTVPSATEPLVADVWMSTTSHSYPGAQVGAAEDAPTTIDYHNTATFTGDKKQLLNTQIYYPASAMVYFVGLYPQGAWQVADDGGTRNAATCTFDGKTDVMCAAEVSNSLSTSATPPTLQFRHLLTWLRFKVSAENQDCIDAWGQLTDIAIESNNKVKVNLGTNYVTFSADVAEPTLNAYTTADEPFTGKTVDLYTTPQEVAYVLAEPVAATNTDTEYTLFVSTVARKNVPVKINLKAASGEDFVGYTSSHQFTISLRFSTGDNIMTTVEVEPWTNGGSIIQPVEE